MRPCIEVQGLGKRYRRGGLQAAYRTFREDVVRWLTNPFQGRRKPADDDHFWALRDVSFTVAPGEIVGIVGRNGAGKSTLLKILARIAVPTEGRAVLRGRIGSLLEVGTGFHPELTGRENVFLAGTVLGMRRAEVRQSYDQIIAFSGLEDFAETPVKHYSSGMYVRLAFAVAAHLRSEILLVDEVLAVGDASFQRKCLGRIDDVASSGRTVLFVSHNMGAVQRLCQTAMLIENGRVVLHGGASEVTNRYLSDCGSEGLSWRRNGRLDRTAFITRVEVVDEQLRPVSIVTTGEPLRVLFEVEVTRTARNLTLSVGLLDGQGQQIFGTQPEDVGIPSPTEPGSYRMLVTMPAEMLMPKPYRVVAAVWVMYGPSIDRVEEISFTAQETDSFAGSFPIARPGYLTVRCDWTLDRSE